MDNRWIIFFLSICIAMSVASCTRSSVEELKVEESAVQPVEVKKEGQPAVDAMPTESVPDVNIQPSAEIPSDKDATNIKVPDVEIDETKGLGDIDDTRVDAVDDAVDEP